jgi:PRD1 phage membrane DNA delivery
MGDRIIQDIAAVATAIVSLAVLAVIVGKNSQTSSVITAAGGALSTDIKAAVSPVS